MLRWSIKTIAKITATVKLLILTARCKQEFKREKAPVLSMFYFPPWRKVSYIRADGRVISLARQPFTKGSCCFMGPVGRVKRRKG